MFSFLFTMDGEVIPEGQEHKKNNYGTDVRINGNTLLGAKNCYKQSESNYGITCAYYAINDISPLDSSKTYWKDFIGKRQYQNVSE